MKILLPAGMYEPAEEVSFSEFIFSGGELQIRIQDVEKLKRTNIIQIHIRLNTALNIQKLFLTLNALSYASPRAKIEIFAPYLPYARQDRVCYPGEANSREVFLTQLHAAVAAIDNRVSFSCVDIHSPIPARLRCDFILPLERVNLVSKGRAFFPPTAILISPDKGAVQQNRGVATELGYDMVSLEKVRDPSTGAITGMQIDPLYVSRLENRIPDTAVIADDICDGGRTFIEAAKILQGRGFHNIVLYVTHGIFSKGYDALYAAGIDSIITTNSIHDNYPSKVKVIDIFKRSPL